jgi:hypothetical protein
MKNLILLALLLSACASKKDAGATGGPSCQTLAGHYISNQNAADTLDIASNCTFTDSLCGYNAAYTVPASDWATTITVFGTNGTPACLANTAHTCELEYDSVSGGLAIECDGGAYLMLFWKQ